MKRKPKVLFVCVHNSARSQIAEAMLKKVCGDQFEVKSAGLTPGKLSPLAVQVMKEVGIDISNNRTKAAFDLLKSGEWFNYLITVCDEASAERCPIFPGVTKRLHWSFPDPSTFEGTLEGKLVQARALREMIADKVKEFCSSNCLLRAA
jgi:arsenate reductase